MNLHKDYIINNSVSCSLQIYLSYNEIDKIIIEKHITLPSIFSDIKNIFSSKFRREIDSTVVERETMIHITFTSRDKEETTILKGFSLLELSLSVSKSLLIEIE